MDFTPPCDSCQSLPCDSGAQVWRIDLAAPPAHLPAALSLLSEDERARFDQFKIPKVKHRFAIARASMRTVLAETAGMKPKDVRFHYGPQGKPSIARECNPNDIRFNLSHSGDTAILAVVVGREVGADVERLRDNLSFQKLATRFFSPAEADSLSGLEAGSLKRQFFRIWTAKEAYIKAVGLGLRIPLDRFAFRFAQDGTPELADTSHDPTQRSKWLFHQFEPAAGCMATIGVARSRENSA